MHEGGRHCCSNNDDVGLGVKRRTRKLLKHGTSRVQRHISNRYSIYLCIRNICLNNTNFNVFSDIKVYDGRTLFNGYYLNLFFDHTSDRIVGLWAAAMLVCAHCEK
jgi:hypothetical protein